MSTEQIKPGIRVGTKHGPGTVVTPERFAELRPNDRANGRWFGDRTWRVHPSEVLILPPSEQPAEIGAPAPVASQHPADLKPRGVKAPLGLIPYSTQPHLAPDAVRVAAEHTGYWPDRDYPHQDPRPFLLALLAEMEPCDDTDVAEAFGHGARKYQPWNWCSFAWDTAAFTEYFGAVCRHLRAYEDGEERASDSGVRHLGHAAAGCMIWIWHENKARAAAPTLEIRTSGLTAEEAGELIESAVARARGEERPTITAEHAARVLREYPDADLSGLAVLPPEPPPRGVIGLGAHVRITDNSLIQFNRTGKITAVDDSRGDAFFVSLSPGGGWFCASALDLEVLP